LDVPTVPEHKSYPPRLVIMILGMLCGTIVGLGWVLARARWQEMDPEDPGKVLAQEVFHTFVARIPRISRNGTGTESLEAKVKDQEEDPPGAKGASAGS
jgi:hypothetical protein